MTTKEDGQLLKKQFSSASKYRTNNGKQFLNLNLNLRQKYSNFDKSTVESFSKSNNYKQHFGITVTDNYHEKGWKKSAKDLCLKTLKNSSFFEEKLVQKGQKRWKNDKNLSSSTLSLHIAAYENSAETFDESGNDLSSKNSKASKYFADSSTKFQDFFEFPRQMPENRADSTPQIMQYKASQKLLSPNQSSSKCHRFRYWQIDSFWLLKIASFFGMAGYLSYIFQPSDLCFHKRNSTLLQREQTYLIKEKYCIMIDTFRNQLCSTQNLTTIPNDLCLAQSREVSAMLLQLCLAILVDICHMFNLYRGIQFLNPTQLSIPIVQIAMLASVCIIITGENFRWSRKWMNANYDAPSIPTNPYEIWLLCFGFILIFMKMIEFIVLYRAFKRNKNGTPKIIKSE